MIAPGGAPRTEPTVYVIDDDESIRELLVWLMRRSEVRAEAFPNAKSFLASYRPGGPGCLILDLFMPGMSGLDLQQYLKGAGIEMPVIFLSGRADVPKAAQELIRPERALVVIVGDRKRFDQPPELLGTVRQIPLK